MGIAFLGTVVGIGLVAGGWLLLRRRPSQTAVVETKLPSRGQSAAADDLISTALSPPPALRAPALLNGPSTNGLVTTWPDLFSPQPISLVERLAMIETELCRAGGRAGGGGLYAPCALPAAVALPSPNEMLLNAAMLQYQTAMHGQSPPPRPSPLVHAQSRGRIREMLNHAEGSPPQGVESEPQVAERLLYGVRPPTTPVSDGANNQKSTRQWV
jgi:hypothetical protein